VDSTDGITFLIRVMRGAGHFVILIGNLLYCNVRDTPTMCRDQCHDCERVKKYRIWENHTKQISNIKIWML